ncbi:hypothetical protein JHK85_007478 [Glycine max]|nr:hypothetical protein JHK85_007478 [Glycine max]KAG5072055.1 hypothetical protein JHK86_007266 [Glycine max]
MPARKRGPFISLTLLSRWRNILGLTVPVGPFLHKYPHVFHVFVHPFRKNTCCRVTKRMKELTFLEGVVVKQNGTEAVKRVKKLLMMSVNGTLRLHALRLIKRELGLPEDFRDSIIGRYDRDFRLVDLEVVALVDWDAEFAVARVEEWRVREYTEKWLSEFETKFAFPVSFPTGFMFERGFKERLRNWQRLPYTMPYKRNEVVRVRTCGGIEWYEKRAVAVLHELLSLTVEKMVEVDRLAHFGGTLVSKLMKTRQLLACDDESNKEESNAVVCEVNEEGERQGDWVIPFLENCEENRSP